MPRGIHGRRRNASNSDAGNGAKKHGKKNEAERPRSNRRNEGFSKAAQRQAELAAKGGSLLGDMPILREQRDRDDWRRWR
ncbi:hypothetical protein K8R03_03825 [Candidatus Kaiserbacteria bacterium]|nr:hypothetical protein [Candidatus Kaiserbacteria bacterium]